MVMNMNSFMPMDGTFPMMPEAPVETTKVKVSVKNMTCNYRLTEDDLHTVFSRYGRLGGVVVGTEDASEAVIEFMDFEDAQSCVKSLNGKVLSGDKGTLVVQLESPPVAPSWMSSSQSTPNQTPLQQPLLNPMQGNSQFSSGCPSPNLPYARDGMMPFPGALPNAYFPGMPMDPLAMNAFQPSAADYAAVAAQAQARAFAAVAQASAMPTVPEGQFDESQGNYGQNYQQKQERQPRRAKNRAAAHAADSSPSRVRKFTCRFDVGINNEKTFQVARRIIGSKGANMKKIFKETGAKLRLRGQGSGFLEGASQQESPEALHLCISAKKIDEYQGAVRAVEALLQGVYKEYRGHCKQKDLPVPSLRVVCREHPLVTMHRNAMKQRELESGAQNYSPDVHVVADKNQEGADPTHDTVEGIQAMIEIALRNGNDREVELLNELLRLKEASNPPSAAASDKGSNQ